jgi:tetratricopeptide (TPR) repeat protein
MSDLPVNAEERFRGLDRAVELAASGKVEMAIEVILSNIQDIVLLHGTVVETALKAERALDAIRSGSDEEADSAALQELAWNLAIENDFEHALKIAKLIHVDWYRSFTLSQILISLARAGRFEVALNTLSEMTDALESSSAVIAVAEQLVLAGEFEKAKDLVRQITDEGDRSMAFEEIGVTLVEMGQFEDGLACLRNGGAEGSEIWNEACAGASRVLVKRGEFLRAFKLSREIGDDRERLNALHWIEAELVKQRIFARLDEVQTPQGAEGGVVNVKCEYL